MAPFATPSRSGSSAWRSYAQAVEGIGQLGAEKPKIALDPAGASDHHMIGARKALCRYDLARESPEAALHTVAHDGTADFLGHGEADAHLSVRILAIADEQHEPGRGHAPAAVGGNEVGALAECD